MEGDGARLPLDPQGGAREARLDVARESLEPPGNGSVRAGKFFQVRLDEKSREDAGAKVRLMCDRLLANPIIEEYRFELIKLESE